MKVSQEKVSETILRGFGGGGTSESDKALDLTEIVATILVPTLLKAEMSLHRDHLERELIKNSRKFSSGCDQDSSSGQSLIVGELTGDNNGFSAVKNLEVKRESACENNCNIDFYEMKAGTKDFWEGKALRGASRWPDSDIIPFVLEMILKDVTGDASPKPLTKDLLTKIFAFYGEHDVAEDESLLEEMISIARLMRQTDEESEGLLLDEFTFAHCLTNDVRRYNVMTEDKLTTTSYDVFEMNDTSILQRCIDTALSAIKKSNKNNTDIAKSTGEHDKNTCQVEIKFTIPR